MLRGNNERGKGVTHMTRHQARITWSSERWQLCIGSSITFEKGVVGMARSRTTPCPAQSGTHEYDDDLVNVGRATAVLSRYKETFIEVGAPSGFVTIVTTWGGRATVPIDSITPSTAASYTRVDLGEVTSEYTPLPPEEEKPPEEKPPEEKPPEEKPPEEGFPTFSGNPLNPMDWFEWIGLVIRWATGQLGIALHGIGATIAKELWDLVPEWLKKAILDAQDATKAWLDLIKNPGSFVSTIVADVFKKSSPSIAEDLATNFANMLGTRDGIAGVVGGAFGDVLKDLFIKIGEDQGAEIRALLETTPAEGKTDELAGTIFTKLTKLVNDLSLSTIIIEALSLGQVESQGRLVDNTLNITGFVDIAKDIWLKHYNLGLGRLLTYELNAKYLTGAPPFEELTLLRRLELIDEGEYADLIAQGSGIDARMAELLYRGSLAPPNLDDYIRYNLRHPSKAKTLKEIQAIVNIDAERFGDIFEERLYLDPSITEARFMYEGGAIDDKGVFNIARLNRFRTTPLEGETKSHAQALTDYLTGFQTRIWRRQKMLALRAAFIAGTKTEDDLRTEAKKLLTNPEAQELFVDTCKIRKELAEAEPKEAKVFSWSIVKALRAKNIWDAERAKEEFEAEGYDEEHVTALLELSTPTEETTPA